MRTSRCFVAVDADVDPDRPLGYFTISACEIRRDILSSNARRKVRYAQVPAARLGRLAVERSAQRRGIGSLLVGSAVRRVATSDVAAAYLQVDAKDEPAAAYYAQFGFRPVDGQPLTLFAAVRNLVLLVERAD